MFKEFGNAAWCAIKSHKAQILIGVGIIGNTAATVFACKQTLTANKILKDHNERRAEVADAKEICRREIKIYDVSVGKEKGGKYYTEQKPCSKKNYENYKKYLEIDSKKEIAKVYGLTAAKFARHYAVPAALYLASNVAICIGTGIMSKQITGLTTSLAAVTTAYADYRNRVKKAIGEEEENRIFTNEQVKVNQYKDIDEEGNEVEKEETIITTDGRYDPYSLLLDRASYAYHNDISKTLTELKIIERELNNMLIGRGIVTLNEVYEALGYAKTEAGALVGWVYSPDAEEQEQYGDGYISFGIFDHSDEYGNISSEPLFVNDQWKSILESHNSIRQNDTDEYDIWLHFNVDGPITKFMNKRPGKPL